MTLAGLKIVQPYMMEFTTCEKHPHWMEVLLACGITWFHFSLIVVSQDVSKCQFVWGKLVMLESEEVGKGIEGLYKPFKMKNICLLLVSFLNCDWKWAWSLSKAHKYVFS